MKKDNLTVNLLKKLIAIPSYNDNFCSDFAMSKFVYNYLKKFPYLKVTKQKVLGKRFNIIAKSKKGTSKLAFACHLDTTEPKFDGKYYPLTPKIVGNKLYGLGAKDMKGGITCLLAALSAFKEINNLTLIFYIDEEYNMLGMKKLVSDFKFKNFKPKLVVAPESKFVIGNAHRGLLDFSCRIKGKTAPSARPYLGKNAILGAINLFFALEKYFSVCESKIFGNPVLNLAYLKGGLLKSKTKKEILLSETANQVPDFAEFRISLRTTDKNATSQKVYGFIKSYLKKFELRLLDFKIYHNYPPNLCLAKKLKFLEKFIKEEGENVGYNDPKKSGFNDLLLLANKYKFNFVNFGPRGDRNHQADEFVEINSLIKTGLIFEKIIKKFCSFKITTLGGKL